VQNQWAACYLERIVRSSRFGRRRLLGDGVTAVSLAMGAFAMGCRGDNAAMDLIETVPTTRPVVMGQPFVSTAARCADAGGDASAPEGHVVYRLPDGHVYRQVARVGAMPDDVSRALGDLGAGTDGFIATSPDGEWLLVQTTRFGCGEDMCVAIVDARACTAQVVVAGTDAVRPESYSTVGGAKGDVVVFGARGNHAADLFAVTKSAAGWSAPVNITATSGSPYNKQPAISADGSHVLFDCGPDPGAGTGTGICEVGVDGGGLRSIAAPNAVGGVRRANHHAGYAPNGGGVVFEGQWQGGAEQVWHVAPGETPALVNTETDPDDPSRPRFTDDNSPCVLPDGRVASLWLGRKGSASQQKSSGHELKVMGADGANAEMLLIGVDVVDIGIGCSK
jgi:hypothetical protein